MDPNVNHQNKFTAEAMLVMASIIHLGKSGIPTKAITDDDLDRIAVCTKVLAEKNEFVKIIFNVECRKAVTHMLEESKSVIEYGTGIIFKLLYCLQY